MATVTVCFTVDGDEDRDLVRWLDTTPKRKRSEAIRRTLRAGLDRGGVTLGDVYQAVKGLERRLLSQMQNGVVAMLPADDPSGDCDEPPEAAAALDALAEL
jgi:hypothetical protein